MVLHVRSAFLLPASVRNGDSLGLSWIISHLLNTGIFRALTLFQQHHESAQAVLPQVHADQPAHPRPEKHLASAQCSLKCPVDQECNKRYRNQMLLVM